MSSSEDEKQMDHLFRDAFLVATENYGYTVQLELHQPEVFTWGRRREVEAVHPFHFIGALIKYTETYATCFVSCRILRYLN